MVGHIAAAPAGRTRISRSENAFPLCRVTSQAVALVLCVLSFSPMSSGGSSSSSSSSAAAEVRDAGALGRRMTSRRQPCVKHEEDSSAVRSRLGRGGDDAGGSDRRSSRILDGSCTFKASVLALRGGYLGDDGVSLDSLTRTHWYDEEGNDVGPPPGVKVPKPAKGKISFNDGILQHIRKKEEEAKKKEAEFRRRMEEAKEIDLDEESEEGETSEWSEARYMEEARLGEQDPSQWDANYERRKSIPEPSDWSHGDRGLNLNPFAGVRMPGWFMSEHTHEQSSDPLIMKQNQRLWDACDAGDADEALRAIEAGAEVNAWDPFEAWEWTALMHACAAPMASGLPCDWWPVKPEDEEDKRLRLVDCLMEHGARIDVTDIYGETPLHTAAVRGYPRLTRRLIELGVNIHRENMYGCSAQRIAEVNQKENPGCWQAAEVIADAGGYDAGWPDAQDIPEGAMDAAAKTDIEKQWEREYDPTGAKEKKKLEAALRRVERDTAILAKRKLNKGEEEEED